MTQFQETATVRTLGDSGRTYTAPFLAITAGLVAVLMAVAVISFALTGRPSDAAVGGNANLAAGNAYVAGLNAAIHEHQLEQAALAMRRPIAATDSPNGFESAQQLRDGWAGALVAPAAADPIDGWEEALIQPREAAFEAKYANGYPLHGGLAGPSRVANESGEGRNQRFINAD